MKAFDDRLAKAGYQAKDGQAGRKKYHKQQPKAAPSPSKKRSPRLPRPFQRDQTKQSLNKIGPGRIPDKLESGWQQLGGLSEL